MFEKQTMNCTCQDLQRKKRPEEFAKQVTNKANRLEKFMITVKAAFLSANDEGEQEEHIRIVQAWYVVF